MGHGLRPDDELPPRVSFRSASPSLLHGAALLIGTLALIYAAVFLYRWATEPIVVSGISPSPSPASPNAAASPFVIVFPDTLTLVTQTPEATPEPTPTYEMLPTPRPPAVCITSTPKGTVCSQPLPPLPTSTPMAGCPVLPGELCVSQGGPVRWLTTPTPVRSMTVGSNN